MDWTEDKFCKECDQLVSVDFDKEFINGVDICYNCLSEKIDCSEDKKSDE